MPHRAGRARRKWRAQVPGEGRTTAWPVERRAAHRRLRERRDTELPSAVPRWPGARRRGKGQSVVPAIPCDQWRGARLYQRNGIKRRRTRRWYWVYPGRLFARKRSSSKRRQIRNGIMIATGTNPQRDPSASGVPIRYTEALAYIGWRTIAYGPVEMTVWSGAISIVADV